MKPNIVVLLLDTARRDRVSCYSSDERETTPFIDSLAADRVKYEQVKQHLEDLDFSKPADETFS